MMCPPKSAPRERGVRAVAAVRECAVSGCALVATLLVAVCLPSGASAQMLDSPSCDSTVVRATPGALSGALIRSVSVRSHGIAASPGLGALVDRFHVRTRESTVRQHLLFAPGDTVDTLRVGESLRNLRTLRFLGDAALRVRRCTPVQGVDLEVETWDVWSAKATVSTGGAGGSFVAFTERNLMGTGRQLTLSARSDQGRFGFGAALLDSWMLGGRAELRVGSIAYGDGEEWFAQARTRQRTVLEPRGVEFNAASTRRRAADAGDAVVDRLGASLLTQFPLSVTNDAATSFVAGAEYERTGVSAEFGAFLVGPQQVNREFAGLVAGLVRQSVAYDTLSWLLPRRGLLDVPLSLETDVIVGVGRDLATGADALHFDGWGGRSWLPSRGSLLVGDAWLSGFVVGGHLASVTMRGSLLAIGSARNGTWSARVGAERVLSPDPDIRARSLFDPSGGALPDSLRIARSTVSAMAERSVRLGMRSRSWGLGVGVFAAASARVDPAREARELVGVGVLGAGLRLDPSRAGRSIARLDVAMPVIASGIVKRRLFISASIDPFLGALRQRSGRRDF